MGFKSRSEYMVQTSVREQKGTAGGASCSLAVMERCSGQRQAQGQDTPAAPSGTRTYKGPEGEEWRGGLQRYQDQNRGYEEGRSRPVR